MSKPENSKTFCNVHQEIELKEEITPGENGILAYFVHPCPACLLDAQYEGKKSLKSQIYSIMNF